VVQFLANTASRGLSNRQSAMDIAIITGSKKEFTNEQD
jgi:hypothetical protein